MKSLVTGATGSIGSNLVDALLREGHQVRVLVRDTSNVEHLANKGVEFSKGDILDAQSVRQAVGACDWVFHAAALYTYSSKRAHEITSVASEGTRNIVTEASRAGVSRIILTSSSVTAGYSSDPQILDEHCAAGDVTGETPYVISKVEQETLAHDLAEALGMEIVTVCPTMSVGPYGNRLGPSNAIVITYLNDPLRLTYPGGCNIVSARDVARAHILAAENGVPGERYLVGSENLEWSEIHAMISQLCGVSGPNIRASCTTCILAAAAEEIRATLERREATTTRQQALMLGRYYWYSHAKARSIGFEPLPARVALAESVAWLAATPHISRELRTRLLLSAEVYDARKALELAQSKLH